MKSQASFIFVSPSSFQTLCASSSLRLEEDGHHPVYGNFTQDLLHFSMSRTLVLVVLHVVHAGELGLIDEGVAFSAGTFFDRTGNHTEYVRRTILVYPLVFNSEADIGVFVASVRLNVSRAKVGELLYPLIVNNHLPTLLQKPFLILSLGHLEHRHTVHTISYAYVAAAVSIESVLRNSGQRLKAT